MLDTPKRENERDAVGEFAFVLTDIEQEAIPDHLTGLAEDLDDRLAAAEPFLERA